MNEDWRLVNDGSTAYQSSRKLAGPGSIGQANRIPRFVFLACFPAVSAFPVTTKRPTKRRNTYENEEQSL